MTGLSHALLWALAALGLSLVISGCAPPQPPGGDLWRALDCVQKGTCR